MISLRKLLDIVCTEAIESGGLPEVPDRVDGAMDNYHAAKQNARSESNVEGGLESVNSLPPIRYDLELIRDENGNLRWVEREE